MYFKTNNTNNGVYFNKQVFSLVPAKRTGNKGRLDEICLEKISYSYV